MYWYSTVFYFVENFSTPPFCPMEACENKKRQGRMTLPFPPQINIENLLPKLPPQTTSNLLIPTYYLPF